MSVNATVERAGDLNLTPVPISHIRLDDQGRAWIDDTNVKVLEVVLDKLAYAWSPEAIHIQHPDLTLAQIHAAFAYYYDHQARMDAEIERQDKEFEAMKAQRAASSNDTPVHKKLRALGIAP